jgi:hypothetical protein
MAERPDLTLFLEAPTTGGFRLVTADGAVVLERPTYERLRRDMPQAIPASDAGPRKITVLVGRRGPQPT